MLVFLIVSAIFAVDPNCDYSKILINQECPSSVGIDWETYGEELYRARGLLYTGKKDLSILAVSNLLQAVTGKHFHWGFECPLAAASTLFTLAQYMASEGRMRRAQALTIMAFVFVRDKGFHDCTPWPIQGWDMMLAGRHVREAVESLDDRGVQLRPGNLKFFDPRSIGIVSICAYAPNEPVRVLAEENHRLYASLHGYKLFQLNGDQIPQNGKMNIKDRKPFFWKVNAIRNAFDDKDIEWVIWMDCDAFFMDPERTIDSVIASYASAPVILSHTKASEIESEIVSRLSDQPAVEVLIAVDSTGINNGVFMMRNSEWSVDFLSKWWESPILQGQGANHNCSDQSTMQHTLFYENTLSELSTVYGRAYDSVEGPIWPLQVRVVPQQHLQSFHKATADAVLSREWVPGDFIKHHPGCHYYRAPCQWMYKEANDWFKDRVRLYLEGQARTHEERKTSERPFVLNGLQNVNSSLTWSGSCSDCVI